MDSYKELSSQELELTRMFEELKQNRSLLQLLLQNCPDSVHRLLDRFTMNISHFPPSCIVEDENNLVHFDFFLFHRQIDDNCQLAFIDLVGFHLCREIMYFLLFSRLLTTTERSC